MDFSTLVCEMSNVGLTILGFVLIVFIVNWLDRNIFNKHRRRNK